MKVSADWLQDYVGEKLTARQMADRLELAGIEVEQLISSIKLDKHIVVGLTTKVTQHPNADKLRLAEVSLGKAKKLVVCGASNLEEGQKVAFAQVGTVLPGGMEIKEAEIRGQKSHGMICSAAELGVGDDHSGILVLDPSLPIGKTLCDIWDSGEILDLTTAANRSDLQSVTGLAREIAAHGAAALNLPKSREVIPTPKSKLVGVVDNKLASRYMVAALSVKPTGKTPQFIQDRLLASGVRPINVVVDITNYVMLELGQPLHAFDAAKVKLPLSVRPAKPGETLTTLDGVARKLVADDLVIADATGVVGLAGVMGGSSTEISDTSSEVILEAASFNGPSLRKTAARYGLRTEASARFERGLPVELPPLGLARALELLQEYAGGAKAIEASDTVNHPSKSSNLVLRPAHLAKVLGMTLADKIVVQALTKLGFEVKPGDTGLKVTVPWWRPDIKLEEDLIEEVGRSVGYDDLPTTLPPWRAQTVEFDSHWAKTWELKETLKALGLFEVVTYSFVSQKQLEDFGYKPGQHLKLKNPMSIEQAYLRSSLMPSLVQAVAKNARYSKDFGLFELSKVYKTGPDHQKLPQEPLHIGIVRRGGYKPVKAALDLLGREFKLGFEVLAKPLLGLHPLHSAEVALNGKVIGQIGEINPEILAKHKIGGELGYLELDLAPVFAQGNKSGYSQISRYPAITRDLALLVDQKVSWSQVKHVIAELDLAQAKFLNDFYGKDLPEGKKSLAVRLTFESMERTLREEEADEGAKKIMKALEQKLGAKLRV